MNQTGSGKHYRRSIRLPDWDYASPGAYFGTICVHGGECLLGKVRDGTMYLNAWGRVAWACWQAIPKHFDHVALDAWVVMPNHVHGILVITDSETAQVGAQHAAPLQSPRTNVEAESLGAIVRSYKSAVTKEINRMRGTPGERFWQRNYWEHIVRTEASLARIRRYIETNPARWSEDRLHPGSTGFPFRTGP